MNSHALILYITHYNTYITSPYIITTKYPPRDPYRDHCLVLDRCILVLQVVFNVAEGVHEANPRVNCTLTLGAIWKSPPKRSLVLPIV